MGIGYYVPVVKGWQSTENWWQQSGHCCDDTCGSEIFGKCGELGWRMPLMLQAELAEWLLPESKDCGANRNAHSYLSASFCLSW